MLFTSIVYSLETEFRWFSPEGAPQNGQCFEIDKSTQGQKLSQKVSRSRCKPNKTYFQWLQKEYGNGHCMEFDSETGGLKYFDFVNNSKCIPSDVEYRLLEKKCYAFSEKAYGNGFILKVSDQYCRKSNDEVKYIWENDLENYSGKCFEVDKSNTDSQYKFQVSNDKCRPKEVMFITKVVNGKQLCIEFDGLNGESVYSSKTDLNKCKASFKYELSDVKGVAKCFRVFNATFESVSLNNCRPNDLQIHYLKKNEWDGDCLHISRSNPAYREKLDWRECLTEKNAKFQLIKNDKNDICVANDDIYSFIVSKSFCDLKTGSAFFKIDSKGYGGKCFVKKDSGLFQTDLDLCRPNQTKNEFVLFNEDAGNCFEVDSINGHQAFSKQISKELCRPVETFFVLRKIKDGLTYCYEVGGDSKIYINRVNIDKCKKNL